MSAGMAGMWLSFVAMGMMIIAALLILLSRTRLKGLFKGFISVMAYILLVFGGLLMMLVVMTWPE